jgi:putative ABC transport system substrate-binding protein
MRRREFITLLGGAAAAWPLAARAQQYAKPFRIGFFPLGSPANQYDQSLVDAFRRGLRRIGLVENRDIALEITWISADDPERLIAKAIEGGVNLLVPCGSSASAAAKAAHGVDTNCIHQRRQSDWNGTGSEFAKSGFQCNWI